MKHRCRYAAVNTVGVNHNWRYLIVPNPRFYLLKTAVSGAYNKDTGNKHPGEMKEIERTQVVNMFFKKKEEKKEKKELLYRENVHVNCESDTKENIIRKVGQMLVDSGYVEQPYVDGMVEREKTFSTFMGNGLALPHGIEAVKDQIKASGIAVMTFRDYVDWDGEEVKVVIGIAGVGEEHMDILSSIAEKMLDDATAEQIRTCDGDTLYQILSGKE